MNKSLSKLIDLFWVIFISSILLYAILDIKNIFSTLKEIQKEKIIYTIKTENSTIAPLYKYGFKDLLKEELSHLMKINKEIKYIKIANIKIGHKTGLKILKFPIVYNNEKLTTLEVGYTENYLIYNFSKKYFTKFVIYFILVLIVSIYFLSIIRNKIKALNKLANLVKNINFKKKSSIELVDDYIEIKNITNALNKLLNQVNSFYKSQKELLKKIIIYKKELETAQKIAEIFTWQYDCQTKKITSSNFVAFKRKIKLNSFDEFINSIKEKDEIFKKIENLCTGDKTSFEEVVTLEVNDEVFYFKVEAILIKTKKIVIGICANITEDLKKQEEISFLAFHDPLTGLVNRTFLKEELKTLAEVTKRNNQKLALIFIDLDNFKFINDTFGHETGDKLLIEIAKRLKKSVRDSDIVSRIGGDEFIIVLTNIKDKEVVKKKVQEIMNKLTKPIEIDGNKIEVTFSAGIALYPDDAKDIIELFQFSDIAMYEAKREGKNRFKFITISLKDKVKNFYSTLEELKNAIKKKELILFFQPKIDIINCKVEGVEALIRWKHPTKGILTPNKFIDIAEKGGIIHLIDSYVLEESIKTIKNWEKNNILKNLNIAINISANKFLEPLFAQELKDLIEKYKIDPSKLEIEITETLSIQNFEYTINVLNKIKKYGVKIALDDFGTGYSSLNYIKRIPFDVIKIDQSFIRDLLKDKDDLIITKMIVEISKILNKENVAEGVENKRILETVKNLGVQIVQGYYFSKPLEEKNLVNFVENFGKTQ